MKRLYLFMLLFVFVPAAFALTPGQLDVTFGSGGMLYNPLNGAPPARFTLDSAGRIIVIGNQSESPFAILVARFNSDGTRDTLFGAQGFVTLNLPYPNAYAQNVVIDSAGKIVIAGDTDDTAYFIVRLNDDGSFDTGFNGNGMLTDRFENDKASLVVGLMADSTNRVIVGGTSSDTVALARYNANGALDSGFGGSGKIVTALGGVNVWMNDFTLDGNDRVVAVGGVNGAVSGFAVARWTVGGVLDTKFSDDGFDIQNLGDQGYARSVTILPGAKILVVGSSALGTTLQDMNGVMLRYMNNGTLDTTLGGSGMITGLDFYDIDILADAFVDASGNIITAGRATTNSDSHLLLARYTDSGGADAAFGQGGFTLQNFSLIDEITQIAASGDSILVLGSTAKRSFLARYHGVSSSYTDFIKNGSYELSAGEKINNWNTGSLSADRQLCNNSRVWVASAGSCAFRFKGSATENSRLVQVIKTPALVKGDGLRLVAAIKGKGAVDIQIRVLVIYNNVRDTINMRLRQATGGEYLLYSSDYTVRKAVKAIKVLVINRSKSGVVFVDDVQLVKVPAGTRAAEGGWMPLPDGG